MSGQIEFSVESLECRKMMAGDVSVSVNNGDLRIEGDDASNELVISEGASAGEYRIVGGNGTTINGQSEITVNGITDDVRISLKDGNDRLGLVGIDVPDDLQIRTDDGNDVVVITESDIQDDVDIRTGRGDDKVHVLTSDVADRLNLRTDAGDDEVLLAAVNMDRANVNASSGSDRVAVYFVTAQDRVSVTMGSGDDLALDDGNTGRVSVNGGSGFDAINSASQDNRSFEAFDADNFFGVTSTNVNAGTVSATLNLERV